MTRANTNAGQALRLIARAEPTWTLPKLAAELGIHPRTVARWEADQHQPSTRNREALRALIRRMRSGLAMAPFLRTVADGRLEEALEALDTASERAAREQRQAEADKRRLAREAEDEAAEDRRIAALAARNRARDLASGVVPAQRQPSITTQVDPFAVVASGQREVAMFA